MIMYWDSVDLFPLETGLESAKISDLSILEENMRHTSKRQSDTESHVTSHAIFKLVALE
jgi:hypothetical protein